MQIKVFLVEDHEIVRQGLKALLERDCTITGEAASGQEAIKMLEVEQPNVVLMDMNMPGMNGSECTRILKEKHPALKILILSMHDDEGYLLDMLSAGADGYILKNASKEELLFAIKRIVNNGIFISPEFTLNLLNKFKPEINKAPSAAALDITEREMDVLQLIGEGLTNAEIADKLFTSVRTIETRRKNLLDKTKTKNTATLIKYAVKNGLLR
jgi:DNA-binding NarL/FixJ family response regulator